MLIHYCTQCQCCREGITRRCTGHVCKRAAHHAGIPDVSDFHLASYSFMEADWRKHHMILAIWPTCHGRQRKQLKTAWLSFYRSKYPEPFCSVHIYFPVPASSPGSSVVAAFALEYANVLWSTMDPSKWNSPSLDPYTYVQINGKTANLNLTV